ASNNTNISQKKNGVNNSIHENSENSADVFDSNAKNSFTNSDGEVKYSLESHNFDKFNKETANNIKLRGGIEINSLNELKIHIGEALHSSDKQNLYLGAIKKETLSKIESDIKQSIFKDKQYAFVVSYDDIRHISEHFDKEYQIMKEVLRVYDILQNYDNVSLLNGNQTRLSLEKHYDKADYLSIDIVSNKKSTIDLVTMYITKINIKNGSQSVPSANNNVSSQRGSTSINTNISQKKNGVNNSISNNSEKSVDVLDKMLKNQ
ncbi:MAG: hypothetical protein RSD17_02235, partial [Oscillospiraceae bacterium]